MRRRTVLIFARLAACLMAATLFSASADARYRQQGPKLVDAAIGALGYNVALSADGNTALLGGFSPKIYIRSGANWVEQASLTTNGYDNYYGPPATALSAEGNTAAIAVSPFGVPSAVFVFIRNNGAWTQQGSRLEGADFIGWTGVESTVALSGDGNTLLLGVINDNGSIGATWVFTRTSGIWTQQGEKLVGDEAGWGSFQGSALAISYDGDTALIGGRGDNRIGAAWVFTRSAGVWSQQGKKLIPQDWVGPYVGFGETVSLAADGNTAIIGGYSDNAGIGSAWVFARKDGVWSQQGNKLIGPGRYQGERVALSGDGKTALVSGFKNTDGSGGTSVYSLVDGVWIRREPTLVGLGASPEGSFSGFGLALSYDGATAIVGSFGDNAGKGAAWVFTNVNNTPHDFNGDSKSDIALRHGGGGSGVWLMNGGAVTGANGFGMLPLSYQLVGQRDFDGDGKADWLWRGADGFTAMWFMNGASAAGGVRMSQVSTDWSVVATGDFNDDGKGDILWRDIKGNLAIWTMDGATIVSSDILGVLPAHGRLAAWPISTATEKPTFCFATRSATSRSGS